uniref:hypothetical protein n=1 Tax=Marinobacterium profundum TaxID=1714300 RepID=UPI0008378C21|nr:hypothetical protein [Marinobacterium profundum]
MKNILNFFDGIFGRIASWALKAVLYCSLGLITLFQLWLVPVDTFEYDEGLSDLDLTELAILLLLPLVIWRYVWRCRQQSWGWWSLLRQLGFVIGTFALLSETFWTLFAVIQGQPAGSDFLEYQQLLRSAWVPVEHLILIFCIYGAAPLPKLRGEQLTKPAPEAAEDTVPPTFESLDAWGAPLDDSTEQQRKGQEANV